MPPLADRLRPSNLKDYIGQKHILGDDKLLFKSIKNGQLFSMIFWGPPGVGKTTLARIIANESNANFMEFSAVSTSIVELKRIFEEIKVSYNRPRLGEDPNKRTIIFIDEIHRFNKAQQDAFLPYVENGTITLIGATTENPSFEIIAPLLSRSRVFVLQSLEGEDLDEVTKRGIKELKVKIDKPGKEFLKEITGGDARMLLNTLEIAASSKSLQFIPSPKGEGQGEGENTEKNAPLSNSLLKGERTKKTENITLTKDDIEQAVQKKALMYDKAGEEHYNTISAFIKSMRASNIDAALYYLARMIDAGEDPKFIARRMVIFASEDIGMAQPTALVVANEVFRAVETIGVPEAQINLAHGVAYLASAKKDRSAYNAYFEALADVKAHGNLPIPMNLRNAPTKLMKEVGYGEGYEMYTNKSLLPEKLSHKKYYKKTD